MKKAIKKTTKTKRRISKESSKASFRKLLHNPELNQRLNQDNREHMKKEKISVYTCLCGLVIPGLDSIIEVIEPIEVPFNPPGWNNNLDDNHCIPAGIYRVINFGAGSSDHHIRLDEIGTEKIVAASCGYSPGGLGVEMTINWRGIKKVS